MRNICEIGFILIQYEKKFWRSVCVDFGHRHCFWMDHFSNFWTILVEEKTSSGSVHASASEKAEDFFFIADCIWLVLNWWFDWSESHCCWHWNESKDEYTFDHIHFTFWTDFLFLFEFDFDNFYNFLVPYIWSN